MGLTGKKTVVLEFDIRKPKVLSGEYWQKDPGDPTVREAGSSGEDHVYYASWSIGNAAH